MKRKQRAILACVCLIAGTIDGHAFAAASDPGDATAAVPPISYRSPFENYRVLGEDKNQPWIESNETVRNIGGWRAYAKEAADANKAGAAKPSTPSAPAAPTTPPAPSAPAKPAPPQHKHGG